LHRTEKEETLVRLLCATLFAVALTALPIGIQHAGPAQAQTKSSEAGKNAKKEGTMKGFVGNIERLTEQNNDYRRVLYTGKNIQLVLMALQPGEEIGEEVHDDRDQFFRIETGEGEVVINGNRTKIKGDDGIVVPAGARHNIVNTGKGPLRLYTLYAPPEHRDGTVHVTKADAKTEAHFDGKTTE
jgi:mannose-6-phosphate isomerase-like protein (cupin superfamily)